MSCNCWTRRSRKQNCDSQGDLTAQLALATRPKGVADRRLCPFTQQPLEIELTANDLKRSLLDSDPHESLLAMEEYLLELARQHHSDPTREFGQTLYEAQNVVEYARRCADRTLPKAPKA